ncbi:MAG: hypothetical protein PHC61_05680 [Chitinivibrionales bacterium]|nr:hypothetical protein [Chitinivibrionales bacterium]
MLINKALRGEEILISRHGKQVARIQQVNHKRPRLPDQTALRKSIKISGASLSKTVIRNRLKERS